MIKRRMFAGLALAGALTVWAGASAFADEGSGDQAEALLLQAETYAGQASDQVSMCAEKKIESFETTSGASEEAVEKASDTVESLAETALSQIEAQLESFAESVENADEAGATLPTFGSFKAAIDQIANATDGNPACQAINSVTLGTTGSTTGDNEKDTERDSSD